MEHKKIIVSASFASGKDLQTLLNKYAQYTDEHFAYWESFAFTSQILPTCDAVLIFNSPKQIIETVCDPGKVIAFMMEPGLPGEHPWMYRKLDQYSQVYSPVAGNHTHASHGFLGWYPPHSYSWFTNLEIPAKDLDMSCIVSGLTRLPGHQERLSFIKEVSHQFPAIDLFGRNTNFIADKMEGLLPYRYSIAMENSSQPHYFTEKINDCFLAWTVPVYFGCSNISSYFPEGSFVQIDIRNRESATKQIEKLLTVDDWTKRIPAIREARKLVLERYQPLAGAAHILRDIHSSSPQPIRLKPVKRVLGDRIRSTWDLTMAKPKRLQPGGAQWQSS